jgi:hypothetical protein
MLFLSLAGLAQSPDRINYQGVARSADGTPVSGQLGLKFELRQGSLQGPVVFTETQSVMAGLQGVFSTQIGKEPGSDLGSIPWQAGPLFLEVSLSLSGGPFTSLGAQQLVSVPYALSANSVPSTYSNNVLTIGTGPAAGVFTLSSGGQAPSASLTSSGGGASVSSPGTNTFNIHVPVTTFSAGDNLIIQGSHPDYTISSQPVLSIQGNSLSISGGNTVSLPAGGVANASLVSSGAATTSTLSAGSFSIDVPVPTFVNTDQSIITGSYPNFTVHTPTVAAGVTPSLVSSGAAATSTLSAGSFSIDVPVPTFVNTDQSIITGSYPNFTVHTPTVAAGVTPSLVSSGAATTSTLSAGSFSIDVPVPTFVNTDQSIITGSYPNFTVHTPTVAAGVTPSLVSSGAATTSTLSTGSFSIDVPVPTFVNTDQSIITGSYPNFTVHTPTVAAGVTPSLVSSGAATTSTLSTGSFSIDVPVPTFVNTDQSIITGSYPNFTVHTPTVAAGVTPSLVSSGAATTSTLSAGSFSIDVPVPTFANTDQSIITGSYPNFTVHTPTVAAGVTPSLVSSGAATTSTLSTGSFSIDVPVPTFVNTDQSIITGSYPNFMVHTPTLAPGLSLSGQTLTVGPATNTISLPSASITGIGAVQVTAAGTQEFTVHVPPTLVTVSSTLGAAGVSSQGLNAYNINIPSPVYNSATGALTTGTSVISILPDLALNGSTLSVGAPSNSLVLPSVVSPSLYASGSASVTGTFPSFTVSAPDSPTITGSGLAVVSPSTGSSIHVSVPPLSYTSASGQLGSGIHTVDITQALSLSGTTLSAGPATNSVDFSSLSPFVRNLQSIYPSVLSHSLGLGTSSPQAMLHIENSAAASEGLKLEMTSTSNNTTALSVVHRGTGVAGYFESDNAAGFGHALIARSNSNSQYALRALNTGSSLTSYAGMFEGGLIARGKTNTGTAYAFKAQETGGQDLFRVKNNGQVEIFSTSSSPAFDLNVFNNGSESSLHLSHSFSGGTGLVISQSTLATSFLSYDARPLYFGNSGTNQMALSPAGDLGLGTLSPAVRLDVVGKVKIADGTEGANKVLTSNSSGMASWQNVGVPSGAVMAYAGATIPAGWMLCDGAAVSRTGATADLFAAIGTAWGSGNGSTTFNLPDMRGLFLRGVDGSAGKDPDTSTRTASNPGGNTGNAVGSVQGDELESHSHTISGVGSQALAGLGLASLLSPGGASATNATGGQETRPKNAYVYYIIKL